MFRRFILALAALSSFSLVSLDAAKAMPLGFASRQPLSQGNTGRAPLAFQIFCLQNPAECLSSKRDVAQFKPSLFRSLAMVNSAVNHEIIPRRENVDVWSIASRYGDCDDYVMTKRHRLIKMGIPSSSLRVAVVRTQRGEGHAVLIVKTTAGEFVLDNLRKNIVMRRHTGYKYLSVSTGNSSRWSL